MIRRIDLRGTAGPVDYRAVVPRAELDVETASHAIGPVLEAIRTRGVEAVLEYGRQFDGVDLDDVAVPPAALRAALDEFDPAVRAGLEESIRRLRATCEAELEHDVTTQVAAGAVVTHRKVPMGRVGLYVPGGLAPLVSSVVMNVVPAQVAGVGSIALASPPQPSLGGLPAPTILAACALLGVDEVYAVGGAQAIGMFAYGAGACPAGRPRHRAGERLCRRGEAAGARRRRDRLRGRHHGDRDPGRRHRRPGVRRGRPAQPGRARPGRRERAGHRRGAAGRRRGGRAGEAGARDAPRRADLDRARRAAVGHRAGRRPGAGARRRRRRRQRRLHGLAGQGPILPDLRILPAHGPLAPSSHARVDELLAHHDRLALSLAGLSSGPATSQDVARQLPWTRHHRSYDALDVFNRGMASMETKAHLELLVARGAASVEVGDEDEGVLVFAAGEGVDGRGWCHRLDLHSCRASTGPATAVVAASLLLLSGLHLGCRRRAAGRAGSGDGVLHRQP